MQSNHATGEISMKYLSNFQYAMADQGPMAMNPRDATVTRQ